MDLKMNGKFLSELRKEQGLTQKQLAEVLGVSDKTISKWECGRGFPDVSMMSPLCEALHISINELVSGQKLSADDYLERAEENMKSLIQDNENKKKGTIRGILTSIAWILGLILVLAFLPTVTSSPKTVIFYFDMIAFLQVLFVLLLSLCFAGRFKDFKNAFRFLRRDADSQEKLSDAITAISLAEKVLLLGGAFCSMFYVIYVLYVEETKESITVFGGNMGIALLNVLYGMLGALILMAIRSRLEKKETQSQY